MRINHANWGEVYRTDYVKGVISDFEKVQDDPILVKPRVKVKVGEIEYPEWIPLFFHPKAEYWDDPTHKATDFNSDDKFFEKAWMSFRGDDEVTVVLRAEEKDDELKPFCVLAFADNVPRIGEDIFESNIGDGFRYQCSQINRYPDETGPDGIDLGLLKNCEKFINEVKVGRRTANYSGYKSYYIDYWRITYDQIEPHVDVPYPGFGSDTSHVEKRKYEDGYIEAGQPYRKTTVSHYQLPIGPILYYIELSTNKDYYIMERIAEWAGENGQEPNWAFNMCTSRYYFPGGEWFFPECLEDAAAFRANLPVTTGGYETPPNDPVYVHTLKVYAAVYSDELNEKAKTSIKVPSEFVLQTDFTHLLEWHDGFRYAIPREENPDLDIYVRPHTRQELIDAGIWPNEVE
jgi:hypothetical protein